MPSSQDNADDSDSGLFDQVKSMVGDVGGGGDHDATSRETTTNNAELIRPTDEAVIKQAVSNVLADRREQRAKRDPDIDNPQNAEVDLDLTADPGEIVGRVARTLQDEHDELLDELDRIVEMQENSVSGVDEQTMLYIIDREAGRKGEVTLLGGGKSMLLNLGNAVDMTADEKRILVEAHTEAARQNGYDRHLLLDTVAFVPHSGADIA